MRKILIIFLCCTAFLLGGYAAYRGYKVWKQKHLVSLAREFIAKSDGRNALLSLQQALRSNPQNLEANRLMAELNEGARSPSALLWRSRVVELNPTSTDDRLALTRTAITMRDYASATNALEGVSEEGKKTVGFQNMAGTVASTMNQLADAEAHFLEASRLDPTNLAPKLNLAVVRLQQTNAPGLDAARTTLKQLCADPTFRCQALRELIVDAMRYQQTNAALAMSKELLQETNSIFSDRLLRLEVLRGAQNPEFKSAITAFQQEASTNSGKIYELTMWEMAKTGPTEVLAWLKSLPANTRTNQPVAMLIAQCQTTLKDWPGLQTSTEKQNWAELEFIRHAFQSRALRGQDLVAAGKAEWELALKTSNNQKQSLVMLLRLVVNWNWMSEAEEILWTIVKQNPGEKWAIRALTQSLFAGGRTRSLLSLYSQQAKANPSDIPIKNNLAMTALLLDAKELKPHELAREVYEKASTNASYISTYAFSLLTQKKNAEALKVIEQLKPQELEYPSIAGYYGMILQATGNKVKAKIYLDLTSKARLLPEEQKLIDKAKAGV